MPWTKPHSGPRLPSSESPALQMLRGLATVRGGREGRHPRSGRTGLGRGQQLRMGWGSAERGAGDGEEG